MPENDEKTNGNPGDEILHLYRRLVDFTGDGIYRYTVDDGRIIFANKGFVRILDLDCSPEELIGKNLKDVLVYTERPGIIRDAAGQSGEIHNFEYHFKTLKGEDRCVLHDSFIYTDPATNEKIIEAVVKDVTNSRYQEETLFKVTRTLETLSRCNKALVYAEKEVDLENEICRIIADIGGYRRVWVGLVEHGDRVIVSPTAQTGFDPGYLRPLDITSQDTVPGQGAVANAVRTGKPVIFRNILTDPSLAWWREEAIALEYASSIALPLITKDKPFGVLEVFSPYPDAFNEDEEILLKELARDLSFGIMALRLRKERERIALDLRQSEERLRMMVNSSPDILFQKDRDLRYVWIPHSKHVSVPPDKIIGKTAADLFLPEEARRIHEIEQKVIETGQRGQAEISVTFNERKRMFDLMCEPWRDHNGDIVGILGYVHDITESKKLQEKLQKSLDGVISIISKIVEIKDPYTSGHEEHTAALAVAIAREMGMSENVVAGLKVAAVIHDVGKIYIPVELLSKPGKLSEAEFNLIKFHPTAGYNILKLIEFPWPVAEIVYQHQERFDGSGYPLGLAGEKILIEARILGVADVVDSMTFPRPYRSTLGLDSALEEISKNKGVLYDPDVSDACLRLFKEKKFHFQSP